MALLSASRMAAVPAFFLLVAPAHAGEIIVPNHAPTTAGNGGYSTLMHTQERSYQLVVGPQELGGLAVGDLITGITWRLPSWVVYADWPGVGNVADITNYDIYLSTSNNPPGSLSTTYTDNIGSDVVQVRGGPLSLTGPHFPGGALTPNVNPLGMVIPFSSSYIYKGGDLLLTIRHTGNSFSTCSLDTVPSPYTQAIGVASYTQANNWVDQGLITMKLVFDVSVPGTAYCFGDLGSGASCPCGNDNDGSVPESGCANGVFASGAHLTASGVASLSADTLVLATTGLQPSNSGLYFQANNDLSPGNVWGDGLRCAGGDLKRLGVRFSDANGYSDTSGYPQPISVKAGNVMAGDTKYYQCWYRNPMNSPCGWDFNSSNGYAVTWLP